MTELLGQIFGLIGVGFTLLTYQMNSNKKILLVLGCGTICFCLNYLLLGAYPGFVLNALALLRNLAYYHRDKKPFSSRFVPIIFAVLMALGGLLSWQGWYSILVIVALVLNTLAVGAGRPNLLRKSILITSPMVLIYNCIVLSIGGILNESVAILSSIVGLLRYRSQTDSKNN